MNLGQLAEATKAEPVLLSEYMLYEICMMLLIVRKGRILRSLACFGAILEVGSDGYASSPSYELYANPAFAKGLASW